MPPLDPSVTTRAVDLMKAGYDADTVLETLVEEGSDETAARALVEQLVTLKRQAMASDPEAIRREAMRMYEEDEAEEEDVVAFMGSLGIHEMHATPEAARLRAVFNQKMASRRPCGRCGTPTFPSDFFFDPMGNEICGSCNDDEQIAAGDRRVEDARLEAAGVSPLAVAQNRALVMCPRCQDYTCTIEHATHTMQRGFTTTNRIFRCTRCGATVSG